MAKPELGTKRICPETGRKFYDLNKDPIVSPYTGHSYPRTFFESANDSAVEEQEEIDEKPLDDDDAPEIVSLDEAESEEDEVGPEDEELPDLGDDDDVDLGDDDDTFLEEEEDEDDVTGIIGVSNDDDDR